ncbi:MAG: type II secretion system protein [Granulosicoccus sp.]|nr:type II secretion system protein [Granulosicoccus sp.]
MKHARQSGFSLIELIIVTIILGVASVPILKQFTSVASSTLINEDIQTASQLAQERAEYILALRRNHGYAAVSPGSTNEILTGKFAGFSRSVAISEPSSIGGCAPGATCKGVVVTVTRDLRKRAEIATVLVDY